MQAPFNSQTEAESAYYGDDGGGSGSDDGGSDDGGSAEWHEPQGQDGLAPDWTLASQDHRTEDLRRWFVLRSRSDSELEFIKPGGSVEVIKTGTPLGEAPHYDTEEGARDAHAEWAEENPDEADEDGESGAWGDWQRVQQIEDWWLFARQHTENDDVQFIVAGQNEGGETIYLNSSGEVRYEPTIFEGIEAAQAAIQAYYERESAGDVDDGDQPTGEAPYPGDVAEDADDAGGAGGKIGNFVRENPLILAAVGGGVVYLAYTGEIDLPDEGDINV